MELRTVILLVVGSISATLAQDTCQSWRNNYYAFCTQNPRDPQYQSSCTLYEQSCLSGGSSSGFQQTGNSQPQPQPAGSRLAQGWNSLTNQATAEQQQAAVVNRQTGGADCGQYKEHYNVWCGGVKQVNPTYCAMMQQTCLTQAQQWASGQAPGNGNAFNNNGLPTGGAGSSRPLTIGQGLNVGPFANIGKTLAINPLQGVGQRTGVDVPIAGIGVSGGQSVDYGGLLGVSQLGQLLGGGRKRRSAIPIGVNRLAIPVGVDQLGNTLYIIH